MVEQRAARSCRSSCRRPQDTGNGEDLWRATHRTILAQTSRPFLRRRLVHNEGDRTSASPIDARLAQNPGAGRCCAAGTVLTKCQHTEASPRGSTKLSHSPIPSPVRFLGGAAVARVDTISAAVHHADTLYVNTQPGEVILRLSLARSGSRRVQRRADCGFGGLAGDQHWLSAAQRAAEDERSF